MVHIYYCIYLYKLFELLATIILVLRKKAHKVTYVHLFNHAFTTLYIWTYARYAPGTDTVMFTCWALPEMELHLYYFLTSSNEVIRPQYLWYRQHITTFQVFHTGLHCLTQAHALLNHGSGSCNWQFSWLTFCYTINVFFTFCHAYLDLYVLKVS